MDNSPSEPRTGAPRSRLGAAVLIAATAFGLLFGITAPDVSPVTPPVTPAAAQAAVPNGATP